MRLLSSFAVAATVLAAPAAPALAVEPGAPVVRVQACGWYAIFTCSQDYRSAQRWLSRYGQGYVIDTSSGAYPNFRSGFFCVVNGPTSRAAALSTIDSSLDIAPSGYVKNAC